MALKKKRVRRHLLEMGLSITSLIDVLMVLIFFLVKSMTVSAVVISPPSDLNIPKTISDTALEDSVSVSISKNEIRLNSEVVLQLANGIIDSKFLDTDKRTIIALKTLLEQKYNQQFQPIDAIAQSTQLSKQIRLPANDQKKPTNSDVEPPEKMMGKIIIQADKDLPFHTIQFLLHTAAVSGFTDYQFVVAPK